MKLSPAYFYSWGDFHEIFKGYSSQTFEPIQVINKTDADRFAYIHFLDYYVKILSNFAIDKG